MENEKYFEDERLSLYQFRGKYYKPYVQSMKRLIKECDKYNQELYNCEEGDLFYDNQNPDNPSSTVGKLIFNINNYLKEIMENFEELESSYLNAKNLGDFYQESVSIFKFI